MSFWEQMGKLLVAALCFFTLDQTFCGARITAEERKEIVHVHNRLRGSATPSASNMEKMVWSEELALLAEGFAAKCNADFATDHSPRSSTFDSIGRNFYVLSDVDILNRVNYSSIVNTWFSESDGYSYDKNSCTRQSCGNYTQLVMANSNHLGCGTFPCERPVMNLGLAGKFLVCTYSPGENFQDNRRPYKTGLPCSRCPIGTECFHNSNLCSSEIFQSPQFRVNIGSGHMFCFNIPGQHNAFYNLVSSSQLFEMNAGFRSDPLNTSTTSWMDSIGVVVFHGGQDSTEIKFSAGAWEVSVGESVSLSADQVEKITVSKGRLTISPTYPGEVRAVSPSIQVIFEDLDVDFSVHYIEQAYGSHRFSRLALFWRSIGEQQSGAHGLLGQLLHDALIDEQKRKLIISDRTPVSVVEMPVWKLHREVDRGRVDRRCWSTVNEMTLSNDVIKGSHMDYQVEDVFSTGFKFEGL